MRGDALFKDRDSEVVQLQIPYIYDEAVTRIVDSAIAQYPERELVAGHSLTTVENVICRSLGIMLISGEFPIDAMIMI